MIFPRRYSASSHDERRWRWNEENSLRDTIPTDLNSGFQLYVLTHPLSHAGYNPDAVYVPNRLRYCSISWVMTQNIYVEISYVLRTPSRAMFTLYCKSVQRGMLALVNMREEREDGEEVGLRKDFRLVD
ncbi:hypothetical protein ANN_26514 [Periplaneta americana]|uniref:Uncharacterized protein n=1 Tax=Periplaneta americana TaxID=6978 RepID=A0ABQ8RYA6_PERAM|nr:hypothetical protein ANN_26514 [Periplaneta americana]